MTVEEDVEFTSQSALENKSWITMSEQLLHSILVGDGQGKRDSSDT